MKIKLRAKFIGGRLHLSGGCHASEALFNLLKMGPRSTIFPVDIPQLIAIGFEPEYVGDLRELHKELEAIKK